MRKKFLAAALSMSMAISMAPAAFAEETSSEEQSTEQESASEEVSSEEASSEEAESEEEEEASSEAAEETYDYSAGLDANGYFEGVKALDYVKLGDYSKIELPRSTVEPSDDDVQAEIDSMLSSYSTTEQITDSERLVVDGDSVNIDYVGSIDGVAFDGGSAEGTDLTIGSGKFIDGFEEQLIGHAPGENFDIQVTFPEDYSNNEELAGKDAVFNITINYITETNEAELNDEFVSENLTDYESAEDYRQSVYDALLKTQRNSAILDYVINNAEVSEVPESVEETIYNQRINYYEQMASYYGMDAETLLSYYGLDLESFRELCNGYASNYLIVQAVMEQEGWTVDSDQAKELLGVDDDEYQSYVDYYGEPYIFFSEGVEVVTQNLANNVVLVDNEEESSEEASSEEATEEVSSEEASSEEATEEASSEEESSSVAE